MPLPSSVLTEPVTVTEDAITSTPPPEPAPPLPPLPPQVLLLPLPQSTSAQPRLPPLLEATLETRIRAERERDRLLDEEKRARAEAEEAVSLRDEFLSIASHELRTPLTSLQLAIDRLEQRLSRGMDVERMRWAVDIAARQIRRLNALEGMLLDVSRIQAGKLELHCTDVDLCAIVRGVVAEFADELSRLGIAFDVQAHRPVVGCWDGPRMEQVVTNLVTNAIKFGEGKPIELAVTTDGRTASLSVTDHGIGIAPETQAHIFDV